MRKFKKTITKMVLFALVISVFCVFGQPTIVGSAEEPIVMYDYKETKIAVDTAVNEYDVFANPTDIAAIDAEEPTTAVEDVAREDIVIKVVACEEDAIVDGTDVNEGTSVIAEIPRYSQLDYYRTKYGDGTVASAGCGITCMAMVATYMLDEVYLPDELAIEYGDTAQSNITRMENASHGLGLEYEYSEDWDYVVSCLAEGKIATILVTERSLFTEKGHFVLLAGMTDDGKIMVNDPNHRNWRKYPDEFENGFEIERAYLGFSAAWIYDKAAYVAENGSAKTNEENKDDLLYDIGIHRTQKQ